WPKGYGDEPTRDTRIHYFLQDNLPALIGAAGLLIVLLYYLAVWWKVGKDPARDTIMPLYEPPTGVSPAAMRYIVRMGFDDKTFTAAILNMAVNGFLSIKEKDGVYTLVRRDRTAQ